MKEEALQLADELNQIDEVEYADLMVIEKAIAMIRRLVEELDKQYKFGVDWGKDDKAVTVLKICEDGVAEIVFVDYQERPTPQTKPLSDEEIDDYTKAYFNIHPEAKLSEQFRIKLYELQEFARTIEETHGIK